MQQQRFLEKLAEEARLQARIQAHQVVPKQLEPLASLIGRHAWKTLLLLSGCLALLAQLGKV